MSSDQKTLNSANKEEKQQKQVSQADMAVEAASDAMLFHAPGADGAAYATVAVGSHLETHAVMSGGFRRWLGRTFYNVNGKAIGGQALQDALNVIAGKALYDGPAIPVAVRLAEHEGAIWLDLADEQWRTVCIDADGWRVVESNACPVRFVRRRGMVETRIELGAGARFELGAT